MPKYVVEFDGVPEDLKKRLSVELTQSVFEEHMTIMVSMRPASGGFLNHAEIDDKAFARAMVRHKAHYA
jgi:hypothetical protein